MTGELTLRGLVLPVGDRQTGFASTWVVGGGAADRQTSFGSTWVGVLLIGRQADRFWEHLGGGTADRQTGFGSACWVLLLLQRWHDRSSMPVGSSRFGACSLILFVAAAAAAAAAAAKNAFCAAFEG
eukprot:scaffold111877_cov17-Tisochrysis_lutea.AAC.2